MKKFVAIAATLALHIGAAFAFQHNADKALPTPNGEVIVVELGFGPVPALAYAHDADPVHAAL
ncbi:MAG TPA: hypothetical protein VIL28_13630 [Steroidobacteraceae bacterium]